MRQTVGENSFFQDTSRAVAFHARQAIAGGNRGWVALQKTHQKVERVIFPQFQTGLAGERTEKYLRNGYGGLMGFELKTARDAGRRFIDTLQLFYHIANIGDARSLAIHPSTTTHSQLSPLDQLATGVTPGYVRLSIGIEHTDDIIADLNQAIEAA